MGKTLRVLAREKLPAKSIFGSRFVIECCETFHLHWRNLRLELSQDNFDGMLRAFGAAANAGEEARQLAEQKYLEIGRSVVNQDDIPNGRDLKIELCENLYRTKYRADSNFHAATEYVHIHYRDVRLEMPLSEFRAVANAFAAAAAGAEQKPRALKELFAQAEERGLQYVVMRNWEGLPDQVGSGDHKDIDLLVRSDHAEEFLNVWNARKVHIERDRARYQVTLATAAGRTETITIDVRTPEDGYYPMTLAQRMLEQRRRSQGGVYILPPDLHYDALLYHAAYHKRVMRDDYRDVLTALHREHGVGLPPDQLYSLAAIRKYLDARDISFTRPVDTSVVAWDLPEGEIRLDRKLLVTRSRFKVDGPPISSRVYKTARGTVEKEITAPYARHEYEVLCSATSPYFARPVGYASHGSWETLELEFIDGVPLSSFDVDRNVTTPAQAAALAGHCLNILDELRRCGVTHRDVRPENILLKDGVPVLIDFGWAVSERNPLEANADELGGNFRPKDGSFCDVYSMGKVLDVVGINIGRFGKLTAAMTAEDPARRVTDLPTLRRMLNDAAQGDTGWSRARMSLRRRGRIGLNAAMTAVQRARLFRYVAGSRRLRNYGRTLLARDGLLYRSLVRSRVLKELVRKFKYVGELQTS